MRPNTQKKLMSANRTDNEKTMVQNEQNIKWRIGLSQKRQV